jgi:hypothetical protein
VTTPNWETPTSFNTTPLQTIGPGRGSLVFYNQGTAFQWMMTGHQYMEDAKNIMGSSAICALMQKEAAYILDPNQ